MAVGCCGSRISLQGLLAEADLHPASSYRGRVARQRLAYTIAAGKAVQVGNRGAYERAMRGLQGLGQFTGDPAQARAAIAATVQRTVTGAAPPSPLQLGGQASAYVGLVATLINAGTDVARAAAGSDVNAQNIAATIDMIVSWVRAILTGSAPTIPGDLSPDLLNGFADFCHHKDAFQTPISLGIDAIISVLRVAAIRDVGAGQAADAITAIKTRIVSLLNGLCSAVAVAAPVDDTAYCASWAPGGIPGPPGGNRCVCPPGHTGPNCSCPPGYEGPDCLTWACPPPNVRQPDGSCINPSTTTGVHCTDGSTAPNAWACPNIAALCRAGQTWACPPTCGPGMVLGPRSCIPAGGGGAHPCPSGSVWNGAFCVASGGAPPSPPSSGGGGSAAVVAIPAALALWWLFL